MRKRLRKKLRLREFQRRGFRAGFKLDTAFTQAAKNDFWNKLFDFVAVQELSIGGSTSGFYVTRSKRGITTNSDRESLEAWLHQQPGVSAVKVWSLDDV